MPAQHGANLPKLYSETDAAAVGPRRSVPSIDERLGEPLATAAQAARYLNIGRSTLYRLAGRAIPCVRFGDFVRFRPADLRAFVARSTRQETPVSRVERLIRP